MLALRGMLIELEIGTWKIGNLDWIGSTEDKIFGLSYRDCGLCHRNRGGRMTAIIKLRL